MSPKTGDINMMGGLTDFEPVLIRVNKGRYWFCGVGVNVGLIKQSSQTQKCPM